MRSILIFVWAVSGVAWLAAQEVPESMRWDDFSKKVDLALKSDDPNLHTTAFERFAEHDYERAGAFLLKLIENRRTPQNLAAQAAIALGEMKDPRVQRLVVDRIEGSHARPNRHLVKAYAAFDPQPPDLHETLHKLITSRPSPALLADLLEITASQNPRPAWIEPLLIETLQEHHYHAARRAAVAGLDQIASTQSVKALIPYVSDKVIGLEVRKVLTRLTGKEYWRDEVAWTTWWSAIQPNFQPTPLAAADFIKLTNKLSEQDDLNLEFYGIRLEGKHILFLLDVSGSMQGDLIETLKRELKNLLLAMDDSYQFGFVLFPLDKYPKRGIEPASERFKEKADRFIDRMYAGGSTPLSNAVEYAFEDVVIDHNVDTIYILTDGEPDNPEASVLALVANYNAEARARIHTISIGQDSEFLQTLANQNGGIYSQLP